MAQQDSDLGALQNVYGISPIFIQRALVVAVLSFVFFIAMLIVFSLLQKLVFFLLATAFLIIELLTLFGWLTQKRNEIGIYENGFTFRRQNYLWNQLATISKSGDGQKTKYEIKLNDGNRISMSGAANGVEDFVRKAESKMAGNKI